MNTELIASISDGIVALAALGAFIVALIGVNSWRKEMKGRNEYELARRIMRSCYKVRDAFWQTRNPMSRMSMEMAMSQEGVDTVSYTHLTLPTKRIV